MTCNNINGLDGVIYSLRSLFDSYGYSEYKMSKFEEYDLYVKNKDFLISDNVITFTDTNGKLLALKPDVTLSIVKNTKIEDSIKKVYYNENVYRVSKKSNGYREIAQIGLECIGAIDDICVAETLMLAVESLKVIAEEFVLEVSPIELISKYVDKLSLVSSAKASVYKCINNRNAHELKELLQNANVQPQDIDKLTAVLALYGDIDEVIPQLKELFINTDFEDIVTNFETTLSILPSTVKKRINIDCSSCENAKYYNAITFRGYIKNVPQAILSGGRYDGLLKRMGKDCQAIGFAIYPDEFDRMFAIKKQFDVDVVVLYGDDSEKTSVLNKVSALAKDGKRVTALKAIPSKLTYKEIIEI